MKYEKFIYFCMGEINRQRQRYEGWARIDITEEESFDLPPGNSRSLSLQQLLTDMVSRFRGIHVIRVLTNLLLAVPFSGL